MSLRRRLYPLFEERGFVYYWVRRERYRLLVNPDDVFPPSETTLALARTIASARTDLALDIGTGCGLLALVLARSGCKKVWAIDKNAKAVECARNNALRNSLAKRMVFAAVDFLTWRPKMAFDLIVSNPPFMPMPRGSRFLSDEIQLAINGGPYGTQMIVAFAVKAASLLAKGGCLILPIPHFGWHAAVETRLSELYDSRVLKQTKIRFWLAEYGDKFATHVRKLVREGKSDARIEGGFLKASLSITEFRLKK